MKPQAFPSEEQELLAKTARTFFAERSPVSRARHLRDTRDTTGFSWELWKDMAELGWVGAHVAEELGGSGLGFLELCLVMEAAGRTLTPEPLISTALLGAETLCLAPLHVRASRALREITRGETIVTLAYDERHSRCDVRRIDTAAPRDGNGFVLSGEKTQVLDGHMARAFVVSARTDRGLSLFLLDAGSPGIQITRQSRIDGRNAALVRFERVHATEDALIGELHRGAEILERVLTQAAIGLAFEMLGAANRAFELTLEHLKSRQQFGVPIGSFQALQHRAARLYVELALSRSCALAAAAAVDHGDEELPRLASLAKARASDTFVLVSNEAVQMHGGIGVTDEHDIGLYLKRARVADTTFGDAAWHRERWAALGGY